MREDALLGAGLLLVAARAADQRVEAEFLDRFEQRDRLVHVARFARMRQAHGAARHRVLDAAHDQLGAEFLRALVAEGRHFGEVVAGVDHQQRVGDAAGAEGLLGALQQHQRILAAREQQGRALEGGGDFAQDEDGLFFQRVELRVGQARRRVHGVQQQVVFGTGVHVCIRCSENGSGNVRIGMTDAQRREVQAAFLAVSCSHHQRPERKSSPQRHGAGAGRAADARIDLVVSCCRAPGPGDVVRTGRFEVQCSSGVDLDQAIRVDADRVHLRAHGGARWPAAR